MTARLVFDCMVYLQAAANGNGPAGECLRRAELGEFELCISPEVTAEIADVLSRPKTRKKLKALTPETVRRFLRRLANFVTVVTAGPKVVTLLRDPKDEKYLNLAIAADARVIVSRDLDLLTLMNADDPAGTAFRAAHPAILILEPAAFLATLPTV